jgi:hypothetical protein
MQGIGRLDLYLPNRTAPIVGRRRRIGKHHSDIAAFAGRQVDRASFRAEKSYSDVRNNAQSTLALFAERSEGLHVSVVNGATPILDGESTNIEHLSATINELATQR